MAVQMTYGKKQAFLSALVKCAIDLLDVRMRLKALAELAGANTVYAMTQDDIAPTSSNVPNPPVAHLTPTMVLNMLQVVQPALETAIQSKIANLSDMLPS